MGIISTVDKKEYEKILLNRILASIKKYSQYSSISSIVLTGSFGRGEPTFKIDCDCLELKSDIEIVLVYTKNKNVVRKVAEVVSAEFKEDINFILMSEYRIRNVCNFNYSLKTSKYKTIFTYDLFNGSRTIWGKDFIKKRHIGLESCDPYEAKRLVANRIGELYCVPGSLDDKEYYRKQWKGKIMLAIASAWLICRGDYVSSYHGQYCMVKKNASVINQELGLDFVGEYEKIFNFLREDGKEYEISDSKLKQYIRHIDDKFKALKLTKSRVNSVSRDIKYFKKYISTGMAFGIRNFEDNILQTLIDEYSNDNKKIYKTAAVWHCVLY